MKETIIAECLIRKICKPKKSKNGIVVNEFYYAVDISIPTRRNQDFGTMFMERTKPKLLKQLKEEYMI